MKTSSIDILRAHLMTASATAMGAELLALLALILTPVSQQTLSSPPFQMLGLLIVVLGVVIIRCVARSAFDAAVALRYVTPCMDDRARTLVRANCPRCWLIVLHLRLQGRPFVLSQK